ncbi:caspase family protein [Microbacterium sp. PAMC21962]|nr:caspase family protein [Microbacterium sp. PAMC21962]
MIGINQYEDADRLSGCVRDATEVAKLLAGDHYGFENNVVLDTDASRRTCLEALWEAAEQEGETLLIYFAGHGGIHSGSGYLMTTDGIGRDPGIGLHELAQVIAAGATNYQHVVTILDACHSGAGSTWTDHRPLTAAAVAESIDVVNASRILMAACRPEQVAYETDEPNVHGAFTKVLLDALAGDAVDFAGNVTVHALFDVVASRMDLEQQMPVFKGDSAGSVILGSGFVPRGGAPLAPNDKAELLAKAERLLDEYQILQTRELSRNDRRMSVGLSACARSLSGIIHWFSETEKEDHDIVREADWQRFRHSVLNYQGTLASIGIGDTLPLGVVQRHVGDGGFGHVWELRDQGELPIAYKVFHGSELSDAVKAKRFRNGYFSMASLSHPRIVAVHELTEAPLGFTMDLVQGADLRSAYVDRDDAAALLTLALDIADTIRFAHGKGVIHRDVKPENVIMEWQENGSLVPKLTDFDLAYIETNRTVTINMVGGVVNYAAPEQFYASNSAIARAVTVDVYAFGQLLFYLAVGSDPSADRPTANMERFTAAVNDHLPYEAAGILSELYERSTKVSPGERPQDMDEVCAQLSRARLSYHAHTQQSTFDPSEICRQVAHAYIGVGGFTSTDEGAYLDSRAGTLSIEILPRGVPTADRSDFVLNISTSQHFGVPGAGSGTQARRILNQRLDRRLQRFDGVTRIAGEQGYFETHIRVDQVARTAAGAARLSDILTSTIGAIEQVD